MAQKQMQAAVVRAFRQPLVIEEMPVPRPGPNQILVRTEACGVCHTDLLVAEGDWPVKPTLLLSPGTKG
jgi:alcohol dehydrogenase, propanol-preferring